MALAGEPLSPLGERGRSERHKAIVLLALLVLAGCAHEDGRGPLTPEKMNPLAQGKDQPLEARIKAVQDNPNIPAPEKERMIHILQTQAAAPSSGSR